MAYSELEGLKKKWGKKYPYAIKLWFEFAVAVSGYIHLKFPILAFEGFGGMSVAFIVCGQISARVVYVRNRNKRREYLCLITTDTSLCEDEIIRLYGKRWDIEVLKERQWHSLLSLR